MPMLSPGIETLQVDALKELQNKRFVKIVQYAYEHVPVYRKKFKERQISPEDIKSLEDVVKVPFTTKDDLRDHYPYGILAVPMTDIIRLHASSGTTGTATVVAYTNNDLEVWKNLMARSLATAGVTSEDIVQNTYGYGLFTGGLGYHYGAEKLGCTVVPFSSGNTKRQIKLMKDLKTTVLCCTPSYATYLVEAAKEEGIDPVKDFSLRIGMFGAEPWSEEQRKYIQENLGLKAMDCFGMSELYGPGVAVECEYQNGLHIWADEFYAETINPDSGDVLEPGQEGEMVITMLSREAMPLLRYRTRDICVINRDKCECGRTHPRIMRLTGRSDDMLIVGGVNIFPSQIESVLFSVPGVAQQYQIIVDRDILEHLYVKVEADPVIWESHGFDRDALTEKVSASLKAVLTLTARVEILPPGSIERSEGKAKRVIDLRKEQALKNNTDKLAT
jgi:phenylacetate-CoA ligase